MATPVPPDLIDNAHLAVLQAIDDATTADAGHEAFPESMWRALHGFDRATRLVVSPDGSAAAVTAGSDSFAARHRELFVGARPDAEPGAITALVDAVLAAEPAASGERGLEAWMPGSDHRIIDALTDRGFVIDRQQHQMRVALPVRGEAAWPPGIECRAFRPGRDEAAWLRVNNRAFLNHPDQGGWIADALARRMAEPWFDPDGFLLAWRDSDLVGYCWTKVHVGPPSVGEIFVIGVDPDAQQLGLGRALVLAGLQYLAEQRQCPTGVLYVAASNTAALALYRSLGFVIQRTDTALRLEALRLEGTGA